MVEKAVLGDPGEQTADDWTVGRHLTALLAAAPESIDRLSWSREQINAHQEAAMRRLLAHAVERSGFHARRLSGVYIDDWRLADLAALPVMTKHDMMGAFDSVLTDPSVTKERADDHLAAHGQSLAYLDGRYLVITSGGSSGERGVFVWGVEAFTAYALSTVRRTMAKVASFGVTRDNPVSGALVAAGSPMHATAIIGQLIGGPGAAVSMSAIPATLPFDEIVDRLNNVQPLFLVGYPSVLVRLADARRSGRLSIAPLAVSATSEPLPTPMRHSIEDAFGVQITNTFGSSEGLCGVSEAGSDAICFAEDTCIVELVDADNRPVAPGEFADKVLVTNLVNHVQPLIRYELTDRFQQVPGEWPDGYLRATVEGRNDERLRWDTVEIHPLVVQSALLHHPEVLEFQVHQTSTGITLHVVATNQLDTAATAASVRDALRSAGLDHATVELLRVNSIERNPATGKVRRFIPLDGVLTTYPQ
ncbi:MAG: phenylacetate--CoA ligase family protein [Acidimicrobiia bacterium]